MTDASPAESAASVAYVPPPGGGRTFAQILVNTAVANVTTSFLWFALTFWVYLETRSVLATGIIGGAYMLLVAVCSMAFGTIVDRHRKHQVMVFAGMVTLVAFGISLGFYAAFPESTLLDLGGPMFWLFSGVILFGAVVENMRNIALSTTVTLLIPVERHANANGLVGTVQGLAFMVTSVFSGLSIGLLGMGWTLIIAIAFSAAALIHLLFLTIPEEKPKHLGFGFGPHQCVGQNLARLELGYGLPRLFERYPNLRLVDDDITRLRFREGRAFFGIRELRVHL